MQDASDLFISVDTGFFGTNLLTVPLLAHAMQDWDTVRVTLAQYLLPRPTPPQQQQPTPQLLPAPPAPPSADYVDTFRATLHCRAMQWNVHWLDLRDWIPPSPETPALQQPWRTCLPMGGGTPHMDGPCCAPWDRPEDRDPLWDAGDHYLDRRLSRTSAVPYAATAALAGCRKLVTPAAIGSVSAQIVNSRSIDPLSQDGAAWVLATEMHAEGFDPDAQASKRQQLRDALGPCTLPHMIGSSIRPPTSTGQPDDAALRFCGTSPYARLVQCSLGSHLETILWDQLPYTTAATQNEEATLQPEAVSWRGALCPTAACQMVLTTAELVVSLTVKVSYAALLGTDSRPGSPGDKPAFALAKLVAQTEPVTGYASDLHLAGLLWAAAIPDRPSSTSEPSTPKESETTPAAVSQQDWCRLRSRRLQQRRIAAHEDPDGGTTVPMARRHPTPLLKPVLRTACLSCGVGVGAPLFSGDVTSRIEVPILIVTVTATAARQISKLLQGVLLNTDLVAGSDGRRRRSIVPPEIAAMPYEAAVVSSSSSPKSAGGADVSVVPTVPTSRRQRLFLALFGKRNQPTESAGTTAAINPPTTSSFASLRRRQQPRGGGGRFLPENGSVPTRRQVLHMLVSYFNSEESTTGLSTSGSHIPSVSSQSDSLPPLATSQEDEVIDEKSLGDSQHGLKGEEELADEDDDDDAASSDSVDGSFVMPKYPVISVEYEFRQFTFALVRDDRIFCRFSGTDLLGLSVRTLSRNREARFEVDVGDIVIESVPPSRHSAAGGLQCGGDDDPDLHPLRGVGWRRKENQLILTPLFAPDDNVDAAGLIAFRGASRAIHLGTPPADEPSPRDPTDGPPFQGLYVTVYDALHLQVNPLRVNLTQKQLDDIYAFFFTEPRVPTSREALAMVNPHLPVPPTASSSSRQQRRGNDIGTCPQRADRKRHLVPFAFFKYVRVAPVVANVTFSGGPLDLANVELHFRAFTRKDHIDSVRRLVDRYMWHIGKQATAGVITHKVKGWVAEKRRRFRLRSTRLRPVPSLRVPPVATATEKPKPPLADIP